jgi:hypothetical protein
MPCSRCAFVMAGSIPGVDGSISVSRIVTHPDGSTAGGKARPSRGPESFSEQTRLPPVPETTIRDGPHASCRRLPPVTLRDRSFHVSKTANSPQVPPTRPTGRRRERRPPNVPRRLAPIGRRSLARLRSGTVAGVPEPSAAAFRRQSPSASSVEQKQRNSRTRESLFHRARPNSRPPG